MKQNDNETPEGKQEYEEEKYSNQQDIDSQKQIKQVMQNREARSSKYLLLQSPFKPFNVVDEPQFQFFDLNQATHHNDLKHIQEQDLQSSQMENPYDINLDNLRFAYSKKEMTDDDRIDLGDLQSRRGLFRYNNILEDLEIGDRNNTQFKKIIIKGVDFVPFQQYIEYIDLTNINVEKLQKKQKLKDISYIYLFQVTYSNIKWVIRRTLEQVILFEKQYIKFMKLMDFDNFEKQYLTLDSTIDKESRENKPNQVQKSIVDNLRLIVNQFNFEQVGIDPLIENRNLQDISNKQYAIIDEFKTQLRAFLEFSDIFEEGKQKHKEVFVYKRAGGRFKQNLCQKLNCKNIFGCYDRRYFLISQEGVMYTKGLIHPESTLREVILFDYNFQVEYGKKQTGQEFGKYIHFSNQ